MGFFNRAPQPEEVNFNKLEKVGIHGRRHVRDLWRQKDLADSTGGAVQVTVPGHGVVLLKFTPAKGK